MPVIHRSNVSPKLFPTLFWGGNATITLHNPATGNHVTLKVRQLKDREDRTKRLPIFYLYVSILGDGEVGKRFAATFFQTTLSYKLGRDVDPDGQLARITAWVHHALTNPGIFSRKGVAVMHEGTCCRCGRQLTHPESIETGFGPECWSVILASSPSLSEEDFFTPIQSTSV